MIKREVLHIGLCKARHNIVTNDNKEVTEFFFEKIENPHDYLQIEKAAWDKIVAIAHAEFDTVYIYVTGLTMALTSVLKMFRLNWDDFQTIQLMHYDRETNTYKAQLWK
tara:strand:+ start:603 stop:929 length:327 start_codon:yes stop_codon:yes gene_type:complete